LEAQGWKVLIIWECETIPSLKSKLIYNVQHFLGVARTSAKT